MKRRFSVLLVSLFVTAAAFCGSIGELTYNESFDKEFKHLKIDLISENVKIFNTNTDHFSVDIYCNDRRKQPVVSAENDTLDISSGRSSVSFRYFCRVEVYLPKDYKFETVDIETTSGNVKIEKMESEDIRIQSTSGDIKAQFLYSDFDTNLGTTSGEIEAEKIYADYLKLSTSSGDIEARKIDCTTLLVQTTSGDQEIYDTLCDSFELESSSGSLEFEIVDLPLSQSTIHTTSGSVKLMIPQDLSFDLAFNTSSGTFENKRGHKRQSIKGDFSQSYNDGGVLIKVDTSSGSLTLEE